MMDTYSGFTDGFLIAAFMYGEEYSEDFRCGIARSRPS